MSPSWLTFIATCLRTTRTDFTPRIYYTCNPGGPGHAYIKRLFIDRAFLDGESPQDYVFIPAKVYDNQVLMQRDPGYLKRLEALPPAKRRASLRVTGTYMRGRYSPNGATTLHTTPTESGRT